MRIAWGAMVVLGVLFAPSQGMADERADELGRPELIPAPLGESEPFEATYELQFSYNRRAGVTLAIPVGSHLHLEGGVGMWSTDSKSDLAVSRVRVLGGLLRVRVDLLSEDASLRPFVRLGGELWTGSAFNSAFNEWYLRLTAGVQIRLHRHFGVELDGGVWYGRFGSGSEQNRGAGIQYGLGLIAFL